MVLKPRYKRRIFWTCVCVAAAAALAVVFIPPMITLNGMKPRLESAIAAGTGIPARIMGDVHFSLLGRATIVAHDVAVPNGRVRAAMFAVPLREIFNIRTASPDGGITIYGGRFEIGDLAPVDFPHEVQVYDSTVRFMDKDYDIIRGRLAMGRFFGTVRTNQHKYDIEFEDDEFFIRNQDNKLEITGRLYSDGAARGELSIDTNNINRWFEFSEPKIDRRIDMTTNFAWDGGYGFEFTDIRGNGFAGDITLRPDGGRAIKLHGDIDYDFSFLMRPAKIFRDTSFDLDFRGHLKFGNREFKHLAIRAAGGADEVKIDTIVADDITITGGAIGPDGARDIMIQMPLDGRRATCLFYGRPDAWGCREFTYGDISGSLSVDSDKFEIFVMSDGLMPPVDEIRSRTARLGRRGTINFQFADAAGTLAVAEKKTAPSFTFARGKTLARMGAGLPFMTDAQLNAPGDFEWNGRQLSFAPRDGGWRMSVLDGNFYMSGDNFKDLMGDMDLRVLNDLEYIVSGTYIGGAVSNLEIKIAGHVFTGTAVGNSITLHTDVLDLDTFINQEFIDNYEELEFLTAHPLTLPFDAGVSLSLSAGTLIYNGDEYKNFVYSLKPDNQTFSITDNSRGSLLASVRKSKSEYDISLQLNRFTIGGALLSAAMPLNIRDTSITGDAQMHTSGQIAHDIAYNMAGDVDLTFDGGYLMGIGIDDFYASAQTITKLNAEYALAAALDGGQTRIKKMHLTGAYRDGNFATTSPITLSVRHADATGALQIRDGEMSAQLYIVMRATAPTPAPIDFEIADGVRNYSLSQIMRDFDAAYMRSFVKTHDKF